MSILANYALQVHINIGRVETITVTDGGESYETVPTVTISGGGGSGATAVAVLNDDDEVESINVTAPGSGYTSVPTVTITGGGGSGATATASTWTLVGNLANYSGLSLTTDTVERTVYSDHGYKEFIPTLLDTGEITLEILDVNQSIDYYENLQKTRRVFPLRATFPDSDETVVTVNCRIVNFELGTELSDIGRATFTLQRSGGTVVVS